MKVPDTDVLSCPVGGTGGTLGFSLWTSLIVYVDKFSTRTLGY